MKYLTGNLLTMIRLLSSSPVARKGLMKWLVKIFLIGLAFVFITWLLFGEAIHPKILLLLPVYILTGTNGG